MVSLRDMNKQDIPFIVSCLEGTNEVFMHQWGGGRLYRHPVTVGQMAAVYDLKKKSTRFFVITADGRAIGSVELDSIKADTRECTICRFLIAPEHRSRGHGASALFELCGRAFNGMGMNRLTLAVFDFNIPAIKCYKKAGFTEYARIHGINDWPATLMEKRNPV